MKRMKFFAAALAVMLGTLMTSCLDSESTSDYGSVLGKFYGLYGSYYVQSADGWVVTLSSESINKLTTQGGTIADYVNDMVYLVYQTKGAVIDEATKTVTNASIYMMQSLSNPVGIVDGAVPENTEELDSKVDSIGNAPIISLSSDNYGKPGFYIDLNTLLIPMQYSLQYSNNTVYGHTISLIYYPEEEVEDGNINLHLRYHRTTDAGSSLNSVDSGNVYFYARYFDVEKVMNRYLIAHGGQYPETVTIKYYQNPLEGTQYMDDPDTKPAEYVLERKLTAVTK